MTQEPPAQLADFWALPDAFAIATDQPAMPDEFPIENSTPAAFAPPEEANIMGRATTPPATPDPEPRDKVTPCPHSTVLRVSKHTSLDTNFVSASTG